jgi:hypothetical protein
MADLPKRPKSDAEIRAQGAAQVGEGSAALRQAHHEPGCGWSEETALDANKRRTFVRMSDSTLVRMKTET